MRKLLDTARRRIQKIHLAMQIDQSDPIPPDVFLIIGVFLVCLAVYLALRPYW